MADLNMSHIGVTWAQFAVGVVLFIFYWYIFHSVLHDWYFSTLDSGEVALLDFGYLLLPLGWILFQSAMHRLLVFQGQYYRREVTIVFALLCLAASGAIGFTYFFKWEAVALVSFDEDVEQPALIALSIGLFIICMAFFVVLSMVVLRLLLFTMYSNKDDYDLLGDGDEAPLLEMQDAGQDDGKEDIESSRSGSGGGSTKYGSGQGKGAMSQRLASERVWETYDQISEYTLIIVFFVILVPGLLFLNGVLPGDWHYLFPVQIESYNLSASSAGWVYNIAFDFRDETYYMKIYGDLIVYFGFISVVGIVSWLCMKFVQEYSLRENFIFVSSLPFTFDDDNWTLAVVQVFFIFFVPVAYGICSSSYVRRTMFEVFYTVHVYSAILFIVVTLWHATQAWRYLVPCLFLYTIDRCLRFYNSTNFARIDNMEVIKLGASNNLEQVTKIAFRIAQFGTTLDGDTRAFYGNIRFKMGQYCFIHIPQISPLEWHPFTISSGPYDRQATFHIKSMGDDQFSGKLCGLGESAESKLTAASASVQNDAAKKNRFWKDLEIFIDGPYGIPFDYSGYDRVVLVAGGIGITPCHSILSGMLVQSMSSPESFPAVDLVWMVRNPEMFDLFKNTWEACKNNDKFTLHFYHTRASEQDVSNQEVVRAGIRYQPNRPTMENALRVLAEDNDKNQLVFCCGPKRLAQDCEIAATQYGAHFYAESFDFSQGDDIKVGSITVGLFGICIVILGAICQMY